MGFDNYWKALTEKFIERSITGDSQAGGILSKAGLLSYYFTGYGLLLPFILFAFFFIRNFQNYLNNNKQLKQFLLFASVVCLLHHIVFWGFSNIHDYAVIKSGFVISMLAAIAVMSFSTRKAFVLLAAYYNYQYRSLLFYKSSR